MKILVCALVIVSGAAHAESVTVITHEYAPLMDARGGKIDACGIEYKAAVKTIDGKILAILGSINNTYFSGKMPGILIKVQVKELVGSTFNLLKAYSASIRAGTYNTLTMQSASSPDGVSFLIWTDISKHPSEFVDFAHQFARGAWLTVSVDPKKSDYTFRLPAFAEKDSDTRKQFSDCTVEGVNNIRQELGGKR